MHRKQDAFAGGDSGAALSPGQAAKSRLVDYVSGENADGIVMPPEGEGRPLTAEEVAVLRRWVDEGAIWPDEADPEVAGQILGYAEIQGVTHPPRTPNPLIAAIPLAAARRDRKVLGIDQKGAQNEMVKAEQTEISAILSAGS